MHWYIDLFHSPKCKKERNTILKSNLKNRFVLFNQQKEMTTLRRVILESKKNNKVHISTNYSSSEESDSENEVSPRTRRKIELLEQQTKNIKPPAVESPVKKSVNIENVYFDLILLLIEGLHNLCSM